ncbi:MAG: hypothetical protein N2V75_06940 [Methanophagales archaeon]|nr:hypothetical protein [Methanophagales archaeon]
MPPKITNKYKETSEKIERIEKAIKCVLNKIGKFKVLDEKLVPEGLKPIARSIAWLVDQVVVQNLKKYKDVCGIEEVEEPPHDLVQYDCILKLKEDDTECFINVKTSLTATDRTGRFDISKADKLIELSWVPDVYYNRANHNLQSRANGMQAPRSNQEFIELLKQKMDEAGHLVHYS